MQCSFNKVTQFFLATRAGNVLHFFNFGIAGNLRLLGIEGEKNEAQIADIRITPLM